MSELAIYMDDFTRSFESEDELRSFLWEREDAGAWQTVPTKNVEVQAIDRESMSGKLLLQSYAAMGKEGILEDTLHGTQLLLKAEDKIYPVRSCAISSILSRARISGHALKKVPKDVLAMILNECLAVASGDALLRLSDEKVSAVHGGDDHDYVILSAPELLKMVVEALEREFGDYQFIGGHFDHSMVTAVWELTDNDELVQAYQDALRQHGLIGPGELVPALRFATSDVGVSGANLYPMMRAGSRGVMLGSALKMDHRNDAGLDKFEEQLSLLYPRVSDSIGNLVKLMGTGIEYSYNTMLRVMKRLGLQKRLSYQIADRWKLTCGEGMSNAHDLYIAMCELPFLLQTEGAGAEQIAKTEENVARALNIRWGDYDYAGEVKW